MNTASSALTPAVGLITAPVLAHALGVDGRGAFSAALAPALVVGSLAAFGLSESVTYHVARNPRVTLQALWRALAFSTLLSIPFLGLALLLAPVLSGGDPDLAHLIQLAALLCFPVLHLSIIRGAAAGRQLWGTITAERVASALLRLLLIVGAALTGHLTALNAVLISSLLPLLTTLAYWRILLGIPQGESVHNVTKPLLAFGARTWVGSVAVMLLSRINQLLLTPLSSVEQVAFFAIAITIADVPFIFTAAVRDVLFGFSSASADITQLARVSRLTLIMTISGSAVIGGTLHLWLSPLFGSGFDEAWVPTILLLVAQIIAVPGLMMGTAASALGRPGMRSSAQVLALLANVSSLLVLAPHLGAKGAGIASIIDTTAVLVYSSYRLRRLTDVRPGSFYLFGWGDVSFLFSQLRSLRQRQSKPAA